jgi:hypothetical protein
MHYLVYIRYLCPIRTKFLNMLKKMFCLAVCQRMRPCLKRIQPTYAYRTPSVCQRIPTYE